MKEFLPVIRSSQLFSGIAEEELEPMLSCLEARREAFPKDAFLLRTGDTAESVGIVLSGSIIIIQEDIWGNRNILSKAGQGQVYAASFACAPGADRVLTMDLHAAQIQGFFDIPVDNMLGNPLFTRYYLSKFDEKVYNHDDFCVVSPDVGSVARSRAFAAKVHMGLSIVDKRRQRANMCEVMNIIGDVEGKTCILYDDIVDTAGSLCNAAAAIKEIGHAKAVYACASHGVLSKDACQRVEDSCIEELMLLNTIPMPEHYTGQKIRQLDASPIFAKAISRIYNETSISNLF